MSETTSPVPPESANSTQAGEQGARFTPGPWDDAVAQGAEHPVLGPAYFSARTYVDQMLANADENEFSPLIKKFSDELYSKMSEGVQSWIMSDLSLNVQGEIWRTVDLIVKALLSGERWAVDKYVLGERYDCEKIRAVVAAHVPAELQDKRIADLQDEISRLQKDLDWERRR